MREYALSIGKKNFFTFGEVYDNEEKIASYIGRNSIMDSSDLIGVDAALDFPLFYALPWWPKACSRRQHWQGCMTTAKMSNAES